MDLHLASKKKIVPVLRYGDLNAGATLDTDSIKMSKYSRATFLVQFHAIAVADSTLRVYSGATDGAATSALTFKYAFGSAAQGTALCDVLAAASTSSALTIENATHDNFLLVVEVDAADMDTANDEEWLTLRISDDVGGGGQTGNVTVIAVLEPRYQYDQSGTALA